MEVEFFDLRWPDTTCIEVQVNNKEKFGKKQYKKGDALSFEVKRESLECVGAMVDHVWQPCPYHTTGYARCKPCKSKEGSFIYTMFDGFNTDMFNAEDMQKIAGPHVVYLAIFDNEIFKVGVSGMGRKELRQVEQGNFATLYIAATSDGTQARQIETLIGKSGIKDKIRSSQKKNSVIPEITKEEAEEYLKKIAAELPPLLEEYPKLKKLLLDPFEFKTWEPLYGIDVLRGEGQKLHAVTLNEGDSVSGTIRGIRGPFVVIDTGEEHVSVNMKDYVGKQLSFTPLAPGLYTKQAFQNSLF